MIQNYFITAWRNIRKNKFYSVINVAGLTIGLAVGILILLWVQDERSFDRFHHQADNIYRLENQVGTGSSIQIWSVTNASIAPAAMAQLPNIEDAVRICHNGYFNHYQFGGKKFPEEKTFFTDPSFFSIFDFPLMEGSPGNPFPAENSVILSATTAKRYFGNESPLGKTIIADDSVPFTVTGIIKDMPLNSSIKADMLFPMSLLNKKMHGGRAGENIDNDWEQFNYQTYLLLKANTNLNTLATKIRDIHLKHEPGDTDIKYLPFPIAQLHLYKADGSDAGISTVRIFTIVALLILVIACINYINISTARSMLRSKEVSLRKVIGASRIHLFLQFISETALIFLFASLLAIGVAYTIMPLFNLISGKELTIDLRDYHIWMVILFSVLGTLILSSIYPALLLSSFKPVQALKGKLIAGIKDGNFRKVLVISQFIISVVLITGTVIINSQMKYIRSRELGYDREHVFSFLLPDAAKHYDAFKTKLQTNHSIVAITRASGNIINLGEQTGDNSWDGKLPNQTFMMYPVSIDKDFIPFFKLNLVAGSNLTGSVSDSNHFILNETAVKQAGIKDPVGKRFRLYNHEGTIIGVVKDFHFASLKQKIEPAIFYFQPQSGNLVFVKTDGPNTANAIAATKDTWNKFSNGNPFNYLFLDESFDNLYRSEEHASVLFDVFAVIAIFISCLGLLGLAAYTAQVRIREIGVRKTLGASVFNITGMLARDFVQLVVIAIVIATPISWYFMNNWLQNFNYRININFSYFIISGLIAMFIAMATISYQSIKAALANPVTSLRSE